MVSFIPTPAEIRLSSHLLGGFQNQNCRITVLRKRYTVLNRSFHSGHSCNGNRKGAQSKTIPPRTNRATVQKDRDDLLRTLVGIESGLSGVRLGDDSSLHGLSSMPEIKKSMKRAGSAMEADSPSVTTPSKDTAHQECCVWYAGLIRRSYCRRCATLYNAYRV